MRYILIAAGLLATLLGGWVILAGNPTAKPSGEFFVQLGVVILAIGLATVDVVEATRSRRQ